MSRSRSFTFADAVDLGKAEAERTADEAAQRPHQMLCLALAGLLDAASPGTRDTELVKKAPVKAEGCVDDPG